MMRWRQDTPPADRLRRWNRGFNPVVVTAAILGLAPLASDDDPTSGPGVVVALGSWLVFAVDFGVRVFLDRQFLRTWKGRLYLAIVVVTFPVYAIVPGLEETDLLAVSRLGWIAVLAISGAESLRDARVLMRRLGLAGLSALTAVVIAALLVERVEDAENGFDTVGESLWWAVVTITTVGYGDRVPETVAGRVVAALLMAGGLTFLGVVAASLAAHFGLGHEGSPPPDPLDDDQYATLLDEVRTLREEVAKLTAEGSATEGEPMPPAGVRAPRPGTGVDEEHHS